jgi:hypothetical protein
MKPPDFSKAVVRPALGNLLVVRQKLISYEAGEISHIENILEGELYRRSANRAESSEITTVEERETTQFDERDLQSTERNEIASESQKEAGKEAIATQGQSTTKDYGKLVENTKSNYARSVTDRAVNNLTQRVKQQRTVREKKSFAEKSVHEFNNVGGENKVRGIYQWVDKTYKTRIMNCGTRYLYDIVVPEPAAFLIETLKNSTPPEPFPLVKPTPPPFHSQDLHPGFYQAWADYYEVSGNIEPPPAEFLETTAKAEHPEVAKKIDAFGASIHALYFDAFKIQIPKGYKAVSGYVQRTGALAATTPVKEKDLILYIGEHYHVPFGDGGGADEIPFANYSFTMNGETGELPVTVQSNGKKVQFNYAIGINCRRDDVAFEKWQLKTYAALMAGYRRQQERYEDKLAQRQALIRAQMARAQNLSHNPSIEQTELRKAFIQTILSEHLTSVVATPIPGLFPVPLDYTKKWAAMVSFFERAFEWENMLYFYYPYFWGRPARWGELVLIQHLDPQFEEFLKAGAARVVVPIRPGFEAAMAHYHETGDVWMGEEMPDMFSDFYVSIIDEIKARNRTPDEEVLVEEWDVKLPTTLVMLKEDAVLPTWP